MSEYTVETFNGDTQELSELVDRSWRPEAKKSKGMVLYNKNILDWGLQAPDNDDDLKVAVKKGDEIVGFFCGLPRKVSYRGREMKSALATLLTVAPEHRGKKLAWKMAYELRRRSKRKGYHSFYTFIYSSRSSYQMAQRYIGRGEGLVEAIKGITLIRPLIPERIKEMYGTRWYEDAILRLKSRVGEGKARLANLKDVPSITKLINKAHRRIDFYHVWTEDEIEWFLKSGVPRIIVHEGESDIDGVLIYTPVDMVAPNGIINMGGIETGAMPQDHNSAMELLNYAFQDAKKMGSAFMSYVDYKALNGWLLKKAGFIKYGRRLSLFVQALNGLRVEPVRAAGVELR